MQNLVAIAYILTLTLFGPTAAVAKNKKTYTCAAYCRFTSIEGIRREKISKSGASTKQAWKELTRACLQEEEAELQVHNDKFTTCSEADSKKACNEPEFFQATKANACKSAPKTP